MPNGSQLLFGMISKLNLQMAPRIFSTSRASKSGKWCEVASEKLSQTINLVYLKVLFFCICSLYVIPDDILHMLSSAMSLLRRCRVNAALTIQLFSQLFHSINMWLFNKLVASTESRTLCCSVWGMRIRARLGMVEMWAEKQVRTSIVQLLCETRAFFGMSTTCL